MSNKEDFAKISDEKYQDKAAKTIYDTLLQIFEQYPTGRKGKTNETEAYLQKSD